MLCEIDLAGAIAANEVISAACIDKFAAADHCYALDLIHFAVGFFAIVYGVPVDDSVYNLAKEFAFGHVDFKLLAARTSVRKT